MNKALIRKQVDELSTQYKAGLIDFSKLIEAYETILQNLTTAQDVFIVALDRPKQELIVWSQEKHIAIENIEDTFSIILECYHTKEQHHVKNLITSFLYNRAFDKLVNYKLKDIFVFPILDYNESVVAVVWLAHSKESDAIFTPVDFDNIENFISLVQDLIVKRDTITTSSTDEKSKEEIKKSDESDQLNILIVDDDIIILKFLSTVLGQQGFHVEVAHSGIEALRIYKSSEAFDLIFMDEVMNGGMHGHQAVTKIRAIEKYNRQKRMPIIALTSDTSKDTRRLLMRSGVDMVLYKPIDPERILDVIARISAN